MVKWVSFKSPKFKFQVRILASPLMRIFKTKKSKFLLILNFGLFLIGVFFGYFFFDFFSGKVPSLVFNIGNYRFHFHHWLYSFVIMISNLRYNFLPFPQFSFGFLSGAIFQGIYRYKDWHQIIFKLTLL